MTGSGASTMAWAAASGSGAPIGSYDFTLTDVTTTATTTDGKAYTIHGSADATLQPETGQAGTVMVTASY